MAQVQSMFLGIKRQVWSVWFFFFASGLLYSQFTSRLPAFRQQLGIDEAGVGMLLMCFASGSLLGLFSSGFVLKYVQSRTMLRLAMLAFASGIILLSTITSFHLMMMAFIVWGFACAYIDVGMNAQAIYLEQRLKANYMGKMHANYSVGCVAGSALASIFAFADLGLSPNFSAVGIIALILLALCHRDLMPDSVEDKKQQKERNKKASTNTSIFRLISSLPFFVLLCGFFSLLSYTAEGSVAEWGGLVMYTTKNASEGLAALAYGVLSCVMALSRFSVDYLRTRFSDIVLVRTGATIAALSMTMVIYTDSPIVCLICYAIMGFGLSPICPISVSRAGSSGLVSPKVAATIVGTIGYGGYLVLPPMLGYLGAIFGLERALFLPLAGLVLLFIIVQPLTRPRIGGMLLVRNHDLDDKEEEDNSLNEQNKAIKLESLNKINNEQVLNQDLGFKLKTSEQVKKKSLEKEIMVTKANSNA